jgi:flagellin-like protein
MKDIKSLFADEDAVSPVIGVILMVAITVILAAVIGAFVLGIGGDQEAAPQTNWNWAHDSVEFDNGGPTAELITATVQHGGGDNADTSQLSVQVDGTPAYGIDTSGSDDTVDILMDSGTISSGAADRAVFATDEEVSDTNVMVYSSPESIAEIEDTDGNTVVDPGDIEELSEGDTVQLVWVSSDGSSSQVVSETNI